MRIALLIGLLALGFLIPWWAWSGATLLYAIYYRSYDLVAISTVLDMSMGLHTWIIPFPCTYTLIALACILFVRHGMSYSMILRGV